MPTVLGGVSLAAALLLLFGSMQRAGRFGDNGLWQAWAAAPAVVRFLVMLACLLGLFGAGAAAFTVTWKRERHLDLLAASAQLVAGVALLVGATYKPQYGASQATPVLLGALLAAGFGAILLSGWKRWGPRTAAGQQPAETQ